MDIIGAILWLVGLTVLPVRDIASRLREQLRQTADEFFLRLNAGIKSFMVRRFLYLSLILATVEIVWAAVLNKFGGWHDRMWIYFLALTVLQITFAFWNEFTGRVVGDEQGDATMAWGFMKRRVNRWLAAHDGARSLYDYTNRSKPLVWYALIPALFIAQAVDLQVHALYVPRMISFMGESYGYTFHQRQWLEILAFVSWSIGGAFLVATGYFVKYTIRRGTRLIEWASTKTTQLALAIPPGIEYRDTLAALGGQIDIIDEDFVGSAADFFITVWYTGPLPLCLAMIFAPWYPLWFMAVIALIATVITTFLYFRTGDAAHAEITADSRTTRRLAFKLSIVGSIAIICVSFLTMIWWEDLLNAVYGVTFYAYRDWWIYLLLGLGSAIAVPFLWKIHLMIKASIREGAWSNPLKELGSMCFIFLSAVTLLLGVAFAMCMVQDIRGALQKNARKITSFRLDATQVPESVSYVGEPTLKTTNGQTTVSFQTRHAARGILEFIHPQQALDAGVSPYLVLGPELEDAHDCGEGDESCDLYRHTVTFESGKYAGPYRIIMRNADEKDTRLFGKVEVLNPTADKKDEKRPLRMGKDALAAQASSDEPATSTGKQGRVAQAKKPCKNLPPLIHVPEWD